MLYKGEAKRRPSVLACGTTCFLDVHLILLLLLLLLQVGPYSGVGLRAQDSRRSRVLRILPCTEVSSDRCGSGRNHHPQ
jgi:hypothetical protein